MQTFVHYFLHLVFPLLIAAVFYKQRLWKTYLMLLATMAVDLDHLLAVPMYDPLRCSIGFHPLHSYWAMTVYVLLLVPKLSRVVGIGLLLHMATDALDCWWMGHCC